MGHEAEARQKAHEKALRLLELRSRTRAELERALRGKGHDADIVEGVLDRLVELGLVDDARFALDRARALGERKGWGPRKLRADLRARGVAEQAVGDALEAAYGEEPIEDVARRVLRRRFGDGILSEESGPKERARAVRFLVGRGFEAELAREILSGD
ncbi:MAG: regulatory protein RecX [Deltaproteobacteria bacterium]|nr:regulatory protein RecX [Deltaproteobacteria bacterium]